MFKNSFYGTITTYFILLAVYMCQSHTLAFAHLKAPVTCKEFKTC